MKNYDVVIVGGGSAGLSAALLLGRSRRRVLVSDTGKTRNAVAQESHGFFTRDGTTPAELVRIGREQLRPYETVELCSVIYAGRPYDTPNATYLLCRRE